MLKEIKNEKVLIQFINKGIGLSEERQKKVIPTFLCNQRKGNRKRIIDIHQGAIEIKSKSGVGTLQKSLIDLNEIVPRKCYVRLL